MRAQTGGRGPADVDLQMPHCNNLEVGAEKYK